MNEWQMYVKTFDITLDKLLQLIEFKKVTIGVRVSELHRGISVDSFEVCFVDYISWRLIRLLLENGGETLCQVTWIPRPRM